jgi:DNA sulfur modification protein DndC
VTKLLDIERQHQGMKRRSSIFSKIESVLKEEWWTEDEILRASNEETP